MALTCAKLTYAGNPGAGHPGSPAVAGNAPLPAMVEFNQHIRPIFTSHCTSCHGGVKQAGDLSFVYRDKALDVLEPGDPDNSYLLERVIDPDDESRMPPAGHGPRLPDHDIPCYVNGLRKVPSGASIGLISHQSATRSPRIKPCVDQAAPRCVHPPATGCT